MDILTVIVTVTWVVIVGIILNYLTVSFRNTIICFIVDLIMMFALKWLFGFVSSFVCLIELIYNFLVMIDPELPWSFPGLPTSQYIIWFIIWGIILLISFNRNKMRNEIVEKYDLTNKLKELDEMLNENVGICLRDFHALNYTYLIIKDKELSYFNFTRNDEKLIEKTYKLSEVKELLVKENLMTEKDKTITVYNVSVLLTDGQEIYVGVFGQDVYSVLIEMKNKINEHS